MKADLTQILTYHVVAGKIDAAEIVKGIKAGGGSYNMKTVDGEPLTAKIDGDKVALIDAKGTGALVEIPDVYPSNGVVHVVDSVLMTKRGTALPALPDVGLSSRPPRGAAVPYPRQV